MSTTSILHSEISSQPATIQQLLDAEMQPVAAIAQELSQPDIRYVLIAARGTSDNAARYGQYLFGALNRWTVALAAPSLFGIYQRPPKLDGALVIGISQSGQSPDIVNVIEEAQRQNAPTIAITNDVASPLATAAQFVIDLHVGVERSVAATKTYTAQLASLALLAASLTNSSAQIANLKRAPEFMQQALQSESAVQLAAKHLGQIAHGVVLGRGFNLATTFEVALKIKELAYIEAEAYSIADFKHGPIALIERDFPAIVIDVGDTMRPEVAQLRKQLRAAEAKLITLSDADPDHAENEVRIPIPIGMPEWLTPLAAIVPGQLLAYHLALTHGSDPDQPRTIRKVTLTH